MRTLKTVHLLPFFLCMIINVVCNSTLCTVIMKEVAITTVTKEQSFKYVVFFMINYRITHVFLSSMRTHTMSYTRFLVNDQRDAQFFLCIYLYF